MRSRLCSPNLPILLRALIFACFVLGSCVSLVAQTGAGSDTEAWLRYARLDSTTAKIHGGLPSGYVVMGKSPVLETAGQELTTGIEKMLGRTLKSSDTVKHSAIVLATVRDLKRIVPDVNLPSLDGDGFWITHAEIHHSKCLLIAAANDRGILYGVFALLSKISRGENISGIDERQNAYAPIRW